MTLYSEGIFQVLGGIRAQLALLTAWLVLLLAFPEHGSIPAMRNLAQHGYELLFLAAFLVVNLLNMMFGRGGYDSTVKIALVLVAYSTVVIHLSRDYRRYRQAAVILLLVMGAIAVYDLPTMIMNPFIARLHEFTPGEIQWFGSWGFFMPYAIALPACFAVARTQKGRLKAALYSFTAAIVLLIIVSTFAASIILMMMGIGGFVLFSIRKARTYVVIAALAGAAVVAVTQFDWSGVPQVAPMVVKITTIFTIDKSADITDPNDPRVRASLMEKSFRSFAAHPLVGVGMNEAEKGYEVVGNHSGFVDSFAIFGVLGFTWYLAFFSLRSKRLVDALRFDASNIIYQGRFLTAAAFAVGAIGNPIMFDVATSTIVFILAFSPVGLTAPDEIRVEPSPVAAG
jgi:hypothetical protein